jgi:hypothetical protein
MCVRGRSNSSAKAPYLLIGPILATPLRVPDAARKPKNYWH